MTYKILISLAVLFQLTLSLCLAQSPPAPAKFIIVTKERFGFKKDSDFYILGTKLEDFRARFGAAEKSHKDESDDGYLARTLTDYHVSDGLAVTARTNGIIIGFMFYVGPSHTLKLASASTDRGIAASSSETEVIRQYGDPYKIEEYKKDETKALYYKFGESILSFQFDHGTLKTIGLNAEFIPFLPK